MKRKNLWSMMLSLMFVMSFIVSCEDSDSDVQNNDQISIDEALDIVDLDDISDEIIVVLNDVIIEDDLSSKGMPGKSASASCRTKTVEVDGNTKTVTIEFGDEGCTTDKGNVLKGTITFVIVRDEVAGTVTITHTYDGFMVNDRLVEGESVTVKTRSNEDGFPQWIRTFEMKVTFDDGTEITREGEKKRVMTEGSDTDNRGDDVFTITGSWESVNKEGVHKEARISDEFPLIRTNACKFIVSGVIYIERDGVEGQIDFGDGSCDNVAIFTNDEGEEKEITLGRHRRKN